MEINKLLENLEYNPRGQIKLEKIIHGEQYKKICSLRNKRFYQESYYKINELPPVIIKDVIGFPMLDFIIITMTFP